GANLVLWGTLQRLGDRVRVTYSLVALPDGARLAGDMVDGPAADFFQIQDQLATRVLAALDLAGIASTPVALRKGLENAGDQESYLQALGHLQRYDRESSVDAAIALLEPLAREAPDSALVQAALGRAYLDKYKLTSGRTWAEKAAMACAVAARSGRDLPEVRVTQGELDRRTGRTEQAIAEFQAVLRSDPGSADAALGLAQTYEDRGELVEAEKQYRKAIELRPSFWAGYNHLGRFYYKHARYGQAAELFGRVAELTPDNVRAYNSMGAAYHQMGRSEEAAAAFQRSIAIQPNADAYSNLGTLEFYRGRYSDAVAAFERATALRPGDSYLWANLGDAYRWAPGKRERAATAYENAIRLARERLEINPRDSEAHMTIALCRAKTGQHAAALRDLEEALAAEPGNVSNFYSAAIVNELVGRRGEALRWIRKSVDSGYGTAEIEREPEFGQLKNDKEFREALSRRAGPRPNAS
ncbi:MAG TPA: tetratricopeptide repeat protein, partial [Candidatus Eisenbacteria bacterium]